MSNVSDFLKRAYPSIIIILAILLGGTTKQGIWTDSLIHILMIPAVVIGITFLFSNKLDAVTRGLVVLVFALLFLQFLPVQPDRGLPEPDLLNNVWSVWSSTLSRSLNSAVAMIAALGFFLYLATLSRERIEPLIRIVFIGVALQVLITVIQLSYSTKIEISGLLPYTIRMGTFQNENHFASLSYLVIPLLAWRFLHMKWNPIAYGLSGLILVFLQLAVGSRSGMVLSGGLFLFSLAWVFVLKRSLTTKFITLAVAGAIIAFMVLTQDLSDYVDDDLRELYISGALNIAKENWLTGTGLSSYFLIWPIFETTSVLGEKYTTHVHSDHVELFMELGISYFVLLLAFVLLILRNAFKTPLTQAATIAIFALILHALVDYHLRTTAISTIFAFLVALILTSQSHMDEAVNYDEQIRNKKKIRKKVKVRKTDTAVRMNNANRNGA